MLLVSASTTGEKRCTSTDPHRPSAKPAPAQPLHSLVHGREPARRYPPSPTRRDRAMLENGWSLTSCQRFTRSGSCARPRRREGLLAARRKAVRDSQADSPKPRGLLTAGGFEGLTPALTSSEALDLADLAEIASELTGRPITRIVVSDEAYRDGLLAHGAPAAVADMLVGLFAARRQGEFAAVDPTLHQLLDRPPTRA